MSLLDALGRCRRRARARALAARFRALDPLLVTEELDADGTLQVRRRDVAVRIELRPWGMCRLYGGGWTSGVDAPQDMTFVLAARLLVPDLYARSVQAVPVPPIDAAAEASFVASWGRALASSRGTRGVDDPVVRLAEHLRDAGYDRVLHLSRGHYGLTLCRDPTGGMAGAPPYVGLFGSEEPGAITLKEQWRDGNPARFATQPSHEITPEVRSAVDRLAALPVHAPPYRPSAVR